MEKQGAGFWETETSAEQFGTQGAGEGFLFEIFP